MQAANFDNWNPFILCAGILALFTAGVFILGSWKVINHQHDGNEDGSHDGNVDVAFGEGLGRGESDGELNPNCDSFSGGNLCQR